MENDILSKWSMKTAEISVLIAKESDHKPKSVRKTEKVATH
jgi:hypothetical protein